MAGWLQGRLVRALARGAGLRVFRFFERALGEAVAPAAPPGLRLRMLEAAEVVALCDDPQLELSAGRVREAYERGDLCAGAFDGASLAGYCWFAFSRLPHLDGVTVGFAPQVVWIYKSLVLAAQRGRGVAPALYGLADLAGAERQRSRSLICVEPHNATSVAAALRSGHQPAGYAAYARRRGGLSAWYSPEARRNAVSFQLPQDGPT